MCYKKEYQSGKNNELSLVDTSEDLFLLFFRLKVNDRISQLTADGLRITAPHSEALRESDGGADPHLSAEEYPCRPVPYRNDLCAGLCGKKKNTVLENVYLTVTACVALGEDKEVVFTVLYGGDTHLQPGGINALSFYRDTAAVFKNRL